MGGLKEKTISGLIWSSMQRFGTLLVSFVTNLILARLLSPDDFGAIGMLAIFIALSNTFIDGGFGAALIQKSNPTQRDYSTIFFWNIIFSAILYIFLYAASPYISNYFKIPVLNDVLRVQSLILVINAVGIIQNNILRKQLVFRTLAKVDLISAVFGATTGIILAFKGFGIWSLVIYQLCNSCCRTALLWIFNRWRPTWEFDFASFRQLFSYGGFLLVSDLLNVLCDNIQGILIGKRFSPSTMGYYTQAKKLEEVPTTSLSQITAQVTFPVFARLKDDKSTLASAHKKCIRALNFLNIPLMILLIIVSDSLFAFLFTDKWASSVPYFRILCMGGLANCLQSINYQLVVAVGQSKRMFKWNLFKRTIGLGLILAGGLFGVEGILCGMALGLWITYFVNACLAQTVTGYTLLQQLKDLLPIILLSACAGIATVLLCSMLNLNYILVMLIQMTLYCLFYVGAAYIFRIDALDMFVSIVKDYFLKFKIKICRR